VGFEQGSVGVGEDAHALGLNAEVLEQFRRIGNEFAGALEIDERVVVLAHAALEEGGGDGGFDLAIAGGLRVWLDGEDGFERFHGVVVEGLHLLDVAEGEKGGQVFGIALDERGEKLIGFFKLMGRDEIAGLRKDLRSGRGGRLRRALYQSVQKKQRHESSHHLAPSVALAP